MKALITGITGFVGSHLADYLLSMEGIEVHGLERWRSDERNIEHLRGQIRLHSCDIRDAASVESTIKKVRPDLVFHLAAQSFVHASWEAPSETLTTNILGQLHIFQALRELDYSCKIQIAGSSEEYGLVHENELPIKETNDLRPLSPYAVSKVAQDLLAYQYHQSFKLHVVRTRAFNHTGPRRGEVFATSNFARQIVMIERGLQTPVIKVGNLDATRDFTDVRDIVKGYWLSLEKGEPGEVYNICSGQERSIRSMLMDLLSLSTSHPEIVEDPARMRPSDVARLQGDYSKFNAATGWKPVIKFEDTMRDLLNYWRARV